jgi:hypothetical protein
MGQLQARYNNQENLDISGYATGLYFLVVANAKGEKLYAKVMKE